LFAQQISKVLNLTGKEENFQKNNYNVNKEMKPLLVEHGFEPWELIQYVVCKVNITFSMVKSFRGTLPSMTSEQKLNRTVHFFLFFGQP
jgi:hypothetical protein